MNNINRFFIVCCLGMSIENYCSDANQETQQRNETNEEKAKKLARLTAETDIEQDGSRFHGINEDQSFIDDKKELKECWNNRLDEEGLPRNTKPEWREEYCKEMNLESTEKRKYKFSLEAENSAALVLNKLNLQKLNSSQNKKSDNNKDSLSESSSSTESMSSFRGK